MIHTFPEESFNDFHIQVSHRMSFYLLKAAQYYCQEFTAPNLDWSLKGQCAGQMICRSKKMWDKKYTLRLNKSLAMANQQFFLNQIMPHEIAHLVVMARYGLSQKIKPHGPQWRSVMQDCFQKVPDVCHKLTPNGQTAQRKYKYFSYSCSCQTHKLSIIRHNRVLKGQKYMCLLCKQALVLDYANHEASNAKLKC